MAAAAGNDPRVLRLENLDTDLPIPPGVRAATQAALSRDDDNSYLPFTGRRDLRTAVARHLSAQTGHAYTPEQAVITCGGTEGMFDALRCHAATRLLPCGDHLLAVDDGLMRDFRK